jgi:chromosome partitioning protein
LNYTAKKVAEIFGGSHLLEKIEELEANGDIPKASKFRSGAIFRKGWPTSDLPAIGAHIGPFRKLRRPISVCVFTTKGGVLKSTLALNTARVAALSGMKVLVVGLDIQGDVTTAIGHGPKIDEDNDEEMENILDRLNEIKGLPDFFNNSIRLEDLIVQTELKNLCLIPETPELVALNDSLSNINRREYWLDEKIITPLKEYFDLIVMDCSPNWNKLTTNALVACDFLLSPLECKINNYRNFKVFRGFLKEFKNEMSLDFKNIFVPTKFAENRKLGMEIKSWYHENVEGCTKGAIRDGVLGEEATAMNLSFVEHDPSKNASKEMADLLKEVYKVMEETLENEKSQSLGPLETEKAVSKELFSALQT